MRKNNENPIHNNPPFAKPLNDKELAKQAKEAQKGPFYTSAQVKQELKKWKSKTDKDLNPNSNLIASTPL